MSIAPFHWCWVYFSGGRWVWITSCFSAIFNQLSVKYDFCVKLKGVEFSFDDLILLMENKLTPKYRSTGDLLAVQEWRTLPVNTTPAAITHSPPKHIFKKHFAAFKSNMRCWREVMGMDDGSTTLTGVYTSNQEPPHFSRTLPKDNHIKKL